MMILLVVIAALAFFILYKPIGITGFSSATEASEAAIQISSSINRITSILTDIDTSLGR